MSRLIIADNPFAPETWETLDNVDVCAELAQRYSTMPDGARLYLNYVADEKDITPKQPQDIEYLQSLPTDSTVFFVNYPAGPIAIIIAVVVAVAVAVVLLIPSIPKQNQRNVRASSGQNNLIARSNSARPLARVADIYGQVRSIPDLAGASFKRYVTHREVEVAHYIIGRGEFEIHDVKDGETDLADVAGNSLQIYAPGTSASTRISNGDSPQLSVGSIIDYPVFTAHRVNEVNGQELLPPNLDVYTGANDLIFKWPDTIEIYDASATGEQVDLTDYYAIGDSVVVTAGAVAATVPAFSTTYSAEGDGTSDYTFTTLNPQTLFLVGDQITATFDGTSISHVVTAVTTTGITVTGTAHDTLLIDENILFARSAYAVSLNLSGTYVVANVDGLEITFANPSAVNSAWATLKLCQDQESATASGTLAGDPEDRWIGPFFLGQYVTADEIVTNIVAPQGLYKDDGTTQRKANVTVEVELTECDSSGVVLSGAAPVTHTIVVEGSSRIRSQRAQTLNIAAPGTAYYVARARRVSDTDKAFSGTVVDEVRWNDCYTLQYHPNHLYGDVTSVIGETLATAGAQALKERRLNMLVTRKLPSRDSLGVAGALAATTSPREIIPSMFEDPVIGGRSSSELDFESLDDACTAVEAHFGTTIPLLYGASFDDNNISLEELISSAAETCFIRPYRRGSTLSFRADIPGDPERVLFNHRNKRPNTEKRTVRFGIVNDYDGVSIEWRDVNGEPFVYELPQPGLLKPKKLLLVGIRSTEHAQLHAWRAWNKLQYQNVAVSFDALQEAALIALRDPILVADNTRPDTITGEIVSQNGLILNVQANKAIPDGTYTCQLQFTNGIVQAVSVAGTTATTITLATAPAYTINTEDGSYAKATFALVSTPLARTATRMLVTKKKPKDGFVYGVECINDDPRYYSQDQLFSVV